MKQKHILSHANSRLCHNQLCIVNWIFSIANFNFLLLSLLSYMCAIQHYPNHHKTIGLILFVLQLYCVVLLMKQKLNQARISRIMMAIREIECSCIESSIGYVFWIYIHDMSHSSWFCHWVSVSNIFIIENEQAENVCAVSVLDSWISEDIFVLLGDAEAFWIISICIDSCDVRQRRLHVDTWKNFDEYFCVNNKIRNCDRKKSNMCRWSNREHSDCLQNFMYRISKYIVSVSLISLSTNTDESFQEAFMDFYILMKIKIVS